jgi:homoaconitate hydratase
VHFYVAAASAAVEAQAREAGIWDTLVSAGATTLPSGCGPCIGLGEGTLKSGEVGISATNRNFQGRMGARDAEVYLSSPAVVAESAVAGYIKAPTALKTGAMSSSIKVNASRSKPAAVDIIAGFPASVAGRLLYLPKNNLNTDGIYAAEFTYREDLTPEQMGAAAMGNYDPEFQKIAKKGDIIVGGSNFGTGSSREQAATALAHRGIQLVIAASFSQTYARNAFNNGFIVLECPALVEDLKLQYAAQVKAGTRTIPTDETASIDFAESQLRFAGKTYAFPALGPVPQQLIALGGAEACVAAELKGA